MVIRPKSSATVVMVLSSANASSTPAAASVIAASVYSGSISEMAPTKVVFPTPNPPLTTSFTVVTGATRSENTDTFNDPFQYLDGDVGRLVHGDHVGRQQIGDD